VGNIVTGDDKQTDVCKRFFSCLCLGVLVQAMVQAGCVTALVSLLGDPKQTVRREAAWALSNITAGNMHDIQAVIDAGAIPVALRLVCSGRGAVLLRLTVV